MTVKYKDLKGCSVHCTDEQVGNIKDVLFDDLTNAIRYLVVDTSKWLPGRKVLIAPECVKQVDCINNQAVHINMTKETLKKSPSLESDLPVSRQFEESLYGYFGWNPYWHATPPLAAGWFPYPSYPVYHPMGGPVSARTYPREWQSIQEKRQKRFDSHLRSCDEVCGYKIASRDEEEFGEVSDLILDNDRWQLIDLVLSSRKWLPGGKTFACSPMFVEDIDERDQCLHVGLEKSILVGSPEFEFSQYGPRTQEHMVDYYLEAANPRERRRGAGEAKHQAASG